VTKAQASRRAIAFGAFEWSEETWVGVSTFATAAEGALSSPDVYRMWGAAILADWESWRDHVRRLRELEGRSGVYAAFEALAVPLAA